MIEFVVFVRDKRLGGVVIEERVGGPGDDRRLTVIARVPFEGHAQVVLPRHKHVRSIRDHLAGLGPIITLGFDHMARHRVVGPDRSQEREIGRWSLQCHSEGAVVDCLHTELIGRSFTLIDRDPALEREWADA